MSACLLAGIWLAQSLQADLRADADLSGHASPQFDSAQLLTKSAHSSWPSVGLGRSRNHFGSVSCVHESNASRSAYVPLQVFFLPTLMSMHSSVQPANARLSM